MAASSAVTAAGAAVAAPINPAPIPLGIPKDLPNAGIYMQMQNQAELAYQQAQAELLAKRNTSYHEYGLGADAAVDPLSQFGKYQSLLSSQESQLANADEQAQQRGLGGGPGLGMQGERALRYQQGADSLALQQDVTNIGQNYATGIQGALAGRNAAVLNAQLSALAGGAGSGGGAGGAGGGNLGDFMYGSTVPGYSDEQLYAAAAAAGGNGTPMHVMHNGEVTVQNGVKGIYVKYQRPDGTDTVWVPIGEPQGGGGGGGSPAKPSTPADQPRPQVATPTNVRDLAMSIIRPGNKHKLM